ncbi:MAG: AMP-binding protein, partial [Candidatus Riflebacteria bacterium]|nr:AMP-binding protein [Candidatus Riflebacteria bacterium]
SSVNYGVISPLNFVASVEIVVLRIYKLCRLYILPYSIIKNPVKLLEYYKNNQIKMAYLPPSYIRVLDKKVKDCMDIVFTGSEPANGIYIEGLTIVNHYSMSELPFLVSYFVIDKKYDIVPIGKIDDVGIPYCLIDENGINIDDGSIGELCVSAPFTRGYINLPEQTSKVFTNGFFHTGDLAHRLPDGNFVLDGRSNDMIKINGNRIEPAEIEAAFRKITDVTWCAAKGIQEARRSYVCLYYKENIEFDEESVNKKMQEFLPSYMIPAYYMKIDTIPLTSSGKMNRRALPDPVINDFKQEYIAPRDEIEKILCESFAKALNIDSTTISIKDDFYKLGGDSIATMLVVVSTDSLDLNAKDIFKYKTVEKLADLVRLRKQNQAEPLEKQLENELHITHKLNQMQIKLFDYQLYKVKGTMWNLPVCHRYEKSVNTVKLKKAIEEVIKAHPTLSFIIKFNKSNELVFEYKPEELDKTEINYSTEEQMEEIKKELIKPFKIFKSPLFRSFIFETEKYVYLFIDLHHVIGDANTISIILRDIEKA